MRLICGRVCLCSSYLYINRREHNYCSTGSQITRYDTYRSYIRGALRVDKGIRYSAAGPIFRHEIIDSTMPTGAGQVKAIATGGILEENIMSITPLVEATSGGTYGQNHTLMPGCYFESFLSFGGQQGTLNVYAGTGSTSSKLLGQPIRILVTHIQYDTLPSEE